MLNKRGNSAKKSSSILQKIELLDKQLEIAQNLLIERHGESGYDELSEKFIEYPDSALGSGFYFEDIPVKNWYLETITGFQKIFGKTDNLSRRFQRIEKDHKFDHPGHICSQFQTYISGEILRDGIEIIKRALFQLNAEKRFLEAISEAEKPSVNKVKPKRVQDWSPVELKKGIQKFQNDYPDSQKVAFIMMEFGNTKLHNDIFEVIKETLVKHNIVGLRADEKEYNKRLFENIETFIHGSDFGIAVFDGIISDKSNPNVALEVGYSLGMQKDICLLKDSALQSLPSDIIGHLYREFDSNDVQKTLPFVLENWLMDNGYI